MTDRERAGLAAGLCLLRAGFTEYAAPVLADMAPAPAANALRLLRANQPDRALAEIRAVMREVGIPEPKENTR